MTRTLRKHEMTMRKPAAKWQDALPSGNGSMGAMVYGSIQEETILLNHEALWFGSITKELPDLAPHLPRLRKLLAEGKYLEANRFYPELLKKADYFVNNGTFQPGFDLKIFTDTEFAFRNYERSLDFETGEVTVKWLDGDTNFTRSLFVSRPDDVIVLSINASSAQSISAEFKLIPHDLKDAVMQNGHPMDLCMSFKNYVLDDHHLVSLGKREDDGSEFGAVARIVQKGGKQTATDDSLYIENADEVMILMKMFADGDCEQETARLQEELRQLPPHYSTLFERHVPEHRELFLRTELQLCGDSEDRSKVNEQLLLDAYNGDVPPALMEKMFDYGRYLLISSSRPGGLPANLQGVWNGDYSPPWSSAFFNNENIQMNYWQSLQGNLAETLLPFFDFFESLIPDMRRNGASAIRL